MDVWELDLDEPGPSGTPSGRPPAGGSVRVTFSGRGGGAELLDVGRGRADAADETVPGLDPRHDLRESERIEIGEAGRIEVGDADRLDGDGPGAPASAPDAAASGGGSGRGRVLGAAVAAVALLAALFTVPSLWGGADAAGRQAAPTPTPTQPAPAELRRGGVAVLYGRLTEPLRVPVPPTLTRVAEGRYLGLRADGLGWVLVSTPNRVVGGDGRRVPMPRDVVGWLKDHPAVRVDTVRTVELEDRTAVQVDYRLRSTEPGGMGRYAGVSLFCGTWGSGFEGAPCSRITTRARVRSTFVPYDGRLLLVEAFWAPDDATGRIPRTLSQAYQRLLADLPLHRGRSVDEQPPVWDPLRAPPGAGAVGTSSWSEHGRSSEL